MSLFVPSPSPWTARMLSVLRIVTGLIFFTSGSTKLFGLPASATPMPPMPVLSQLWIGGVLEVVGGALIILGFLTRPTAFILAGEMAVAYFQFHFARSFWPTVNMGQPAILDCFIFLYLMLAGAGPWSVDAMLARRRTAAQADIRSDAGR